MTWNVLLTFMLASWLLMSLISVNHLIPVIPFLSRLPTAYLGVLGWSTALLTLLVFGSGQLRQLFAIAAGFFILGLVQGPILEPASDPMEHLKRIREWNCGKVTEQMPQDNRGLWHYSMAGVILCTDNEPVEPEKMLRTVNASNGLFWAVLTAGLFILGKKAGLQGRWVFLSVLLCFLFFGTNRFSYFRYYSLAPSFSSLFMYWVWAAIFFFKKSFPDGVKGIAAAILTIPILWVNHVQEAVFLGFITIVWVIVNITDSLIKRAWVSLSAQHKGPRSWGREGGTACTWLLLLFAVGWVVPQSDYLLDWLSRFSVTPVTRNVSTYYQTLSVDWHGLYVGGRIYGLRIVDTLGMMGALIALLALPYFLFGCRDGTLERKVRIFILAVLPFIGYFVPFLHYLWSSHVMNREYWRLCYASIFWIFLADFMVSAEVGVTSVVVWVKDFIHSMGQKWLKGK